VTIVTLYEYRATVNRWVDGDTVDLTVDVGFHMTYRDHFRLYGIDTAERGRPLAAEAKARANELAPVGSDVLIRTSKSDKYGRWLTIVSEDTGIEVNSTLLHEGLAKLYFGGTKDAS
jgi:micrococcal nuclease